MKARLLDLSLGLNRKQRVTLELDEDFRGRFDALHEKEVSLEIKQYREKRSLDANAYCWVLIGKLSAHYNVPSDEVYRMQIQNLGGNYEVVAVQDRALDNFCRMWEKNGMGWVTQPFPSKIAGCTNVRCFYGSSVYDTRQMARLIDVIVRDCKDAGIETLPPDKLDAMKEAWK